MNPYPKRKYKRTIAEQARFEAMKLAARRKRPYRGKYPVVTDYGVVPYYESEFALAKRIRHERAHFQFTCDEWARKGWGDYWVRLQAWWASGGFDSVFSFVTDPPDGAK